MAIMTYADLRRRADSMRKSHYISEAATIKRASRWATGKSVFLSHCSQDAEALAPVIDFFAEFDASVYVAEDDDGLPAVGSAKTAKLLRDAIVACPRLVVLVTEKSYRSGWIPWELGIADGLHGVACAALLPVAESAFLPDWAQREYLGLYPRIEFGEVSGGEGWRVMDPRDGGCWPLTSWLRYPVE